MQIIREAKIKNSRRILAEPSEDNPVEIGIGSPDEIRLSIEGDTHYYMIKLDASDIRRIKELSQ